jgi:hypothetical protein
VKWKKQKYGKVVLGDHSFYPNKQDSLGGWCKEIAHRTEEDIELDNFSFL